MVRDMTEGKPLKLILSFCIPLIIGSLFQQLYNMVDSIVVGQFVGVKALAAVGATGSINFFVIGFLLGICSGFCIPVSQNFGANDLKTMRKYIANSIYLSVIIIIILTVVTMLTTRQLLTIMKTPADIFEDSYTYIIIIFAGSAATMFYNILAGILRALGDSKTPLYFLAIASGINVVLDLLFVIVFSAGVAGVAYATVLSQCISGLLCLRHICKKFPILKIEKDEFKYNRSISLRLLFMGIPMGLQFSLTAIGTIILQTSVNTLGSSVVAAITAANKVQTLAVQPLETLGLTMATYAGQNLGAGKVDRIRVGMQKSLIVSTAYSIIACVLVSIVGSSIALLFINKGEVTILTNVDQFLRINGIFYFSLGSLLILRNCLQGLGYGLPAMLAGIFELFARAAVAFFLVNQFQYNAVCFANPAAWVAANVLLIPVYIIVMKRVRNKIFKQ